MLKSHKAIVGSIFFNLTYLILPAGFMVIGILFRGIAGSVPTNLFLGVQAILMMYESSTEYFGYGPIYRKNNLGMEYLKTSVLGMQFFQKSILTDSLLRIARSLAYTLIPAILIPKSEKQPLTLLLFALVLATVSVWSVNLTRYVTMYGFLMIIVAPLLAAGMFLDTLGMMIPVIRLPLIIVTACLLATGVWFTGKMTQKKIRASYSDL